jgi:hypothetical protein
MSLSQSLSSNIEGKARPSSIPDFQSESWVYSDAIEREFETTIKEDPNEERRKLEALSKSELISRILHTEVVNIQK